MRTAARPIIKYRHYNQVYDLIGGTVLSPLKVTPALKKRMKKTAPMGTKYCRKCFKVKNLIDFSLEKKHTDGRGSYCKDCRREFNYVLFAKRRANGKCQKGCKASLSQFSKNFCDKCYFDLRDRHMRSKYGISLQERQVMFEKQKGLCAICFRPMLINQRGFDGLVIDHDHMTGKVRGLLHSRCNQVIGMFEENLNYMEAFSQGVAQYLKVYS